jgi:hypothetical protein
MNRCLHKDSFKLSNFCTSWHTASVQPGGEYDQPDGEEGQPDSEDDQPDGEDDENDQPKCPT